MGHNDKTVQDIKRIKTPEPASKPATPAPRTPPAASPAPGTKPPPGK